MRPEPSKRDSGQGGEITYTAFDSAPRRWGDYTGMTIDPDGLTFWYLGEYSKDTGTTNGRWGTWINSFTFPSCGLNEDFTIDATPVDQEICEGSLATYGVTLADVGGWSELVTLGTDGAPGSDSFVPSALTPPGTSTLTITGATPGTTTFDIVGSGGSGPTEQRVTVSLTVIDLPPGAPSMTSPADGASNVAVAPTYSWSPASGSGAYEIEVATDAGFTTIVDSATDQRGELLRNGPGRQYSALLARTQEQRVRPGGVVAGVLIHDRRDSLSDLHLNRCGTACSTTPRRSCPP